MKTCPCDIQRFFSPVKIKNCQLKNFGIFLIFTQNIDCGYTLEVLTSTHNLCYGSAINFQRIPEVNLMLVFT